MNDKVYVTHYMCFLELKLSRSLILCRSIKLNYMKTKDSSKDPDFLKDMCPKEGKTTEWRCLDFIFKTSYS